MNCILYFTDKASCNMQYLKLMNCTFLLAAPDSTNLLEHQDKLQKLTDIISFLEN